MVEKLPCSHKWKEKKYLPILLGLTERQSFNIWALVAPNFGSAGWVSNMRFDLYIAGIKPTTLANKSENTPL